MAVRLLVLLCAACTKEYELIDGSEYYFYPEEYEEDYSTYNLDLSMEKGDKIFISIKCESGQILIDCKDLEGFPLSVVDKLDKELFISDKDSISFRTEIVEDTKGYLKLKFIENEHISFKKIARVCEE